MNNLIKKHINIAIIVLLIVIIFYQIIKLSNYAELTKRNDVEFLYAIDSISSTIKLIEEKRYDEVVGMAGLAAATRQASSLYRSTSFYNKNKLLNDVLQMLNNNLTTRSDIKEVIDKNDLMILVPSINKLHNNPLDQKVTEEFFYLVRKHTVIGSTLP